MLSFKTISDLDIHTVYVTCATRCVGQNQLNEDIDMLEASLLWYTFFDTYYHHNVCSDHYSIDFMLVYTTTKSNSKSVAKIYKRLS